MNLKPTHPLIRSDYGAMAPTTTMDFFPCCGATAFFFLSSIKRTVSERLEIMQSYTNKADELYLEAENVKLPDYIPPFTSCYKTLYQQEELIERARMMEDSARQIRQQFHAFADSEFLVPTSTLLRKAVVLVKKREVYVLHRTAFECSANGYEKQTLLIIATKKRHKGLHYSRFLGDKLRRHSL